MNHTKEREKDAMKSCWKCFIMDANECKETSSMINLFAFDDPRILGDNPYLVKRTNFIDLRIDQ